MEGNLVLERVKTKESVELENVQVHVKFKQFYIHTNSITYLKYDGVFIG